MSHSKWDEAQERVAEELGMVWKDGCFQDPALLNLSTFLDRTPAPIMTPWSVEQVEKADRHAQEAAAVRRRVWEQRQQRQRQQEEKAKATRAERLMRAWPLAKQRRSNVNWHDLVPEVVAKAQISYERGATVGALLSAGWLLKDAAIVMGASPTRARQLQIGASSRKSSPVERYQSSKIADCKIILRPVVRRKAISVRHQKQREVGQPA